MASAFGSRLRRLREAKKLTLQQVADAVGCTKAYIWELEMAVAVIGGLITSTVLSLVVVPAAYTLVDDLEERVLGKLRRKAADASEVAAPP